MNFILTLIKFDYLQRVRSYRFLITLCISLAVAYTFVPEPNAGYSTIRIGNYIGHYNSEWFGYVTAIMTSIFLSLIGFYLINSGIGTDIRTRVSYFVATSTVSDFKYALYKMLSNALVLFTITGVVFIMSIILFVLYNDGYPFNIMAFIQPYLFITCPALFVIAALGVVFEIIFGKYSVVQNMIFFIMFSGTLVFTPEGKQAFAFDVFGSEIVMDALEDQVRVLEDIEDNQVLTIGYVLGNTTAPQRFLFKGIDFPFYFLLSRLVWMILSVGILYMISLVFQRFRVADVSKKPTKEKSPIVPTRFLGRISLTELPKLVPDYNIFPLVKTELYSMFRTGKGYMKWITLCVWFIVWGLPLDMAYTFGLPVLWFLQVTRISDVGIKDDLYETNVFTSVAYKPIKRVLLSRILAAVSIILILSLPVLVRNGLSGNYASVWSILLGGTGLILFSVCSGLLTQGKKCFEVVFFMITYLNLNQIPVFDYFGALSHGFSYVLLQSSILIILGTIGYGISTFKTGRGNI